MSARRYNTASMSHEFSVVSYLIEVCSRRLVNRMHPGRIAPRKANIQGQGVSAQVVLPFLLRITTDPSVPFPEVMVNFDFVSQLLTQI